jgi:hypothetical protein
MKIWRGGDLEVDKRGDGDSNGIECNYDQNHPWCSMSLEKEGARPEKKKGGFVTGAAFGAALLASSAAGINEGYDKLMERINSHVLSPGAIVELKQVSGASDKDISVLEVRLREIMAQELKRIMARE